MPATYDKIATYTVPSAASTYTFSSITGTYTDIDLIIFGKSVSGIQNINIQFNGDTGARYSKTLMFGNGSTAVSSRSINQTNINAGFMNTTGSLVTAKLMNYSNSTTHKTVLLRAGDAADSVQAAVGLWQGVSTPAITSITIIGTGNFDVGSMFTLYGIKAA